MCKYLGCVTSVILVCSPNSFLRNSSRGPDSYGREPLNTCSFILKYRQRRYSIDLPVAVYNKCNYARGVGKGNRVDMAQRLSGAFPPMNVILRGRGSVRGP